MASVTKRILTEKVVARLESEGVSVKFRIAGHVVQATLQAIADELARGNRIELRDFGTFEARLRPPRVAKNPRTGRRVSVPARVAVKFRPGRGLRQHIESHQSPQPVVTPDGRRVPRLRASANEHA